MSGTKQYVPIKPNICFLDYTYCFSKNCKNNCGRKMSELIKKAIDNNNFARVTFALFCEDEK